MPNTNISDELFDNLKSGKVFARPGDFIQHKFKEIVAGTVIKISVVPPLGLCYTVETPYSTEEIIPVRSTIFLAPREQLGEW